MTLIASFKIGDHWFLLGDLLISANTNEKVTLRLPSIGDINQLISNDTNLVPIKLSRKICQFGNLALAWAGKLYPAKAMIQQLFDEIQLNGPITLEKLDAFFNGLDSWIRDHIEDGEVALLGYLIDPYNNNPFGFAVNYSELSSLLLDNAKIAGSGSKLFQEYFDHHSEFRFIGISDERRSNFESAVCAALGFTGMLLQLEIGTQKTLSKGFGGSYELISHKQGRFQLFDDLIYSFWNAKIDGDEIVLSPVMKFFKQSYFNDILIIRTLEMGTPNPNNPLFLTERSDEVYYFPPIYRELPDQEKLILPTPDLDAFMLCSYILVHSNKGIEVLTKFDWSKQRQMPLRFVDNGEKMEMQVQGKYIEDILNTIEIHKQDIQ